ncbi:MAG: hypothetical protein HY902_16760 [Deltaproteobacteria bacterium]|nr:hypothetical protein [Deltaproteobacteria bacterium]
MYLHDGRQQVEIADELGRGGEGVVYAVRGQSDRVAKLYNAAPDTEASEKLTYLVALGELAPELTQVSAWPLALLRDGDGAVRGFVMQRLDGPQPLHHLYSPEQRKVLFPKATWRTLIEVAADCARLFGTLHARGVVVGDVNERNVLVNPAGQLVLVDADSFQVQQGDRVFVTGVGVVDYTPPELQGSDFRTAVRTPDHDRFGLAVLLFKLLFMGRHPFSGGADGDLAAAIAAKQYDYGEVAERLKHLIPLTLLPKALQDLFAAALTGEARPAPQQWQTQLGAFAASLQACPDDPLHVLPPGLVRCPWCAIESLLHYAYFARPDGGAYASLWTPREEQLQNLRLALAETWAPPDPTVFLVPADQPAAVAVARRAMRIQVPVDPRSWYLGVLGGLAVLAGLARLAVVDAIDRVVQLAVWGGVLVWAAARWLRWRFKQPWLRDLATLRTLLDQVEHAGDAWRAEAYQFRSRDRQLLQRFGQLAAQHEGVVAFRTAELERLTFDAVDENMRAALQKIRIEDAELPPAVGEARRQALRIRGLLTAADVDERQLLGLPGFTPQVIQALVEWRQALEVRLGGRKRPAARPEHRAAIDNNCQIMQEEIEAQLAEVLRLRQLASHEARAQLEATYRQTEHVVAVLKQHAERLLLRLREG